MKDLSVGVLPAPGWQKGQGFGVRQVVPRGSLPVPLPTYIYMTDKLLYALLNWIGKPDIPGLVAVHTLHAQVLKRDMSKLCLVLQCMFLGAVGGILRG